MYLIFFLSSTIPSSKLYLNLNPILDNTHLQVRVLVMVAFIMEWILNPDWDSCFFIFCLKLLLFTTYNHFTKAKPHSSTLQPKSFTITFLLYNLLYNGENSTHSNPLNRWEKMRMRITFCGKRARICSFISSNISSTIDAFHFIPVKVNPHHHINCCMQIRKNKWWINIHTIHLTYWLNGNRML